MKILALERESGKIKFEIMELKLYSGFERIIKNEYKI